MKEFILASASPRRKDLLDSIGARFRIIPAEVTEEEDGDHDPEWMVWHNAELKAAWVAERHPESFVLGADTTVYIDNRVLNKPRDLEEARGMLTILSGRTHIVYTGFSLHRKCDKLIETRGVRSSVSFKPLDDTTIDRYFGVVNVLDKAGAYGIQEGTDIIIESFEGSHSNIMGLPIDETKELLSRHKLI